MPGADEHAPRLVIFAGPNGSGKSTIYPDYTDDPAFPAIYINADDIARTLLDVYPDDYFARNKAAADEAERRRLEAIQEGRPYAFETVMSTPGKLALIEQAKRAGYHVLLVYVGTSDPAINQSRVAERVRKGGHDVEPAKISARYAGAMRLLPSAAELADIVHVFDNSGEVPELAATIEQGALTLHAPIPWVLNYLSGPWRKRRGERAALGGLADQQADARTRPTIEPASLIDGTAYVGPVVKATDHHILQRVGYGRYTLHDKAIGVGGTDGQFAVMTYRFTHGKLESPPAVTATTVLGYVEGVFHEAQARMAGTEVEQMAGRRRESFACGEAFAWMTPAAATRLFPELRERFQELDRLTQRLAPAAVRTMRLQMADQIARDLKSRPRARPAGRTR